MGLEPRICLKKTTGEGHFALFYLSLGRKLPGQRQSFTQRKLRGEELDGKEVFFAPAFSLYPK